MKQMSKLLLILVALLGLSCKPEPSATPPKDWIEQRVSNAQQRLAETEAGQLLWKSIDSLSCQINYPYNKPLC